MNHLYQVTPRRNYKATF